MSQQTHPHSFLPLYRWSELSGNTIYKARDMARQSGRYQKLIKQSFRETYLDAFIEDLAEIGLDIKPHTIEIDFLEGVSYTGILNLSTLLKTKNKYIESMFPQAVFDIDEAAELDNIRKTELAAYNYLIHYIVGSPYRQPAIANAHPSISYSAAEIEAIHRITHSVFTPINMWLTDTLYIHYMQQNRNSHATEILNTNDFLFTINGVFVDHLNADNPITPFS